MAPVPIERGESKFFNVSIAEVESGQEREPARIVTHWPYMEIWAPHVVYTEARIVHNKWVPRPWRFLGLIPENLENILASDPWRRFKSHWRLVQVLAIRYPLYKVIWNVLELSSTCFAASAPSSRPVWSLPNTGLPCGAELEEHRCLTSLDCRVKYHHHAA